MNFVSCPLHALQLEPDLRDLQLFSPMSAAPTMVRDVWGDLACLLLQLLFSMVTEC